MISKTEAEHKFDQVAHLVGELSRYVNEAARDGKPIHEVERHIWDDLLKIGHAAGYTQMNCRPQPNIIDAPACPGIRIRG